MITHDEIKQVLKYDPILGVFTWIKSDKRAGCEHSLGYRIIRIKGKAYKEHRIAWLYVYGQFPSKDLDHINRIKNDNRLSNLRLATESENGQNLIKAQRHSKTGVLGVSPSKNRYQASIAINGMRKHLGRFNTIEEANVAYLNAKKLFHPFCAGSR